MNRLKRSIRMLRNWLYTYRIHVIAWSIFIFWETVVVIYWVGMPGTFGNYAIHYTINITFFYTYTLLLEKATAFHNGALWKVPLVVISTILIYLGLVTGVDILLNTYTNILPGELPSLRIRIAKVLYRGSFFLIFSTGYYFLKRFIKEKTEKSRIEKQRFQMLIDKEKMDKELAMSKNAFMKAQINPHLLFNTFEFVHQKLSTYSPEDAKVMLYLSDMMRFAANTQHNEGYVYLSEEIAQCENLIGLHRITQGAIYIELASGPDLGKIKLIPLVLLTILENMFKHGNLNDIENKATIDVYTFDGKLRIESRNLPRLVKSKVGFGSGMDNISNRLKYAYHQNAEMTAGIDEEGFYTLNISISLNALTIESEDKKTEQTIAV
ncbi:sensor histidine kinase [Pedobacter sp. SG918]|uniref:sensor histidine kinase n=1 Tax=Pedobacter sp. SG918 TaxID=2587136 RepID=UPI00146C7631|nr:sensor histidine kinase [Pedobacter sp. SG918]NMN36212.1 sensor histidine kinase YesM [Pedobacter sp. SG918]